MLVTMVFRPGYAVRPLKKVSVSGSGLKRWYSFIIDKFLGNFIFVRSSKAEVALTSVEKNSTASLMVVILLSCMLGMSWLNSVISFVRTYNNGCKMWRQVFYILVKGKFLCNTMTLYLFTSLNQDKNQE